MPGYSSCSASASRCAEECQNACLPSGESHLNNSMEASVSTGREMSQSWPLILAASTSAANRGLMLSATWYGVTPACSELFLGTCWGFCFALRPIRHKVTKNNPLPQICCICVIRSNRVWLYASLFYSSLFMVYLLPGRLSGGRLEFFDYFCALF